MCRILGDIEDTVDASLLTGRTGAIFLSSGIAPLIPVSKKPFKVQRSWFRVKPDDSIFNDAVSTFSW